MSFSIKNKICSTVASAGLLISAILLPANAALDFSSTRVSLSTINCNDSTIRDYVSDIANSGYLTLEETSSNNLHVRLQYPSNSNHSLVTGQIGLYQNGSQIVRGSAKTLRTYSSFLFLNKPSVSAGAYNIIAAFVLKSDTSKGCVINSPQFDVIKVPSINSVSVSPTQAESGSIFTWQADISGTLPTYYRLRVDFGDGYKTMSRNTSTRYSYSRVANTVGNNRVFTVIIENGSGQVVSEKDGLYTVLERPETQYAPSLTINSPGSEVEQNKQYCIEFRARDDNDNLRHLFVNWGENATPDAFTYPSGAGDYRRTMCNTYTRSGTYAWRAEVEDHTGLKGALSGRVDVTEVLPNVPGIQSISVNPTSAESGSIFTFSATLSGDLPDQYQVQVDFGDDFKQMQRGSNNTFSFSQVANTVGQNRIFIVRILDDSSQSVTERSSTYTVTEPEEPQFSPTLAIVDTSDNGQTEQEYCVSLLATDANANLKNLFINWGVTQEPETFTYEASTSSLITTMCHVYQNEGTYTWTANVFDHTNRTASVQGSATIINTDSPELDVIINFLSESQPLLSDIITVDNLDAGLSRAETVALIDTFLFKTVSGFKVDTLNFRHTFADIPENEWYIDALLRLAHYQGRRNETVINKANNNFRPFDKVSRQEFVAIIIKGLNLSIEPGYEYIDSFEDFNDSNVWATWTKPYFNTAVKYELIKGNNNFLYPNVPLTIREALLVLDRALKNFDGDYRHDGEGFNTQEVSEIRTSLFKTIGTHYTPQHYLPDQEGIVINDVVVNELSKDEALASCGVPDNVVSLAVNASVANEERVKEYYSWQADSGYFRQFGDDIFFKTVCFFPSESLNQQYFINVVAGDNIGYFDEFSTYVDNEIFDYDSTNVDELHFDAINIVSHNDVLRASKTYSIDLSGTIVSKGDTNYSLENVDVVMILPDGIEHLLFSGHMLNNIASFLVPKLPLHYGQNVILRITGRAGEIQHSTALSVKYLPLFVLHGQVINANLSSPLDEVLIDGTNDVSVFVQQDGSFYAEFESNNMSIDLSLNGDSGAYSNEFSQIDIQLTYQNPVAYILYKGVNNDADNDGERNSTDPDDDNDQIPDIYEIAKLLDPYDSSDAGLDEDDDGLTNLQEFELGTDIYNADTDGDGIIDGADLQPNVYNPTDPIGNMPEIAALSKTNYFDALHTPQAGSVLAKDETFRMLWDAKLLSGLVVDMYILIDDPSGIDGQNGIDVDVLKSRNWFKFNEKVVNSGDVTLNGAMLNTTGNAFKILLVTNTSNWTINSGLIEVVTTANGLDFDNDGMLDEFEILFGLNPRNSTDADEDKDNDGLTNLEEFKLGTNPTLKDTDRDGMDDNYELENDYDPLNGNDCPKWMCGSGKIWQKIPVVSN